MGFWIDMGVRCAACGERRGKHRWGDERCPRGLGWQPFGAFIAKQELKVDEEKKIHGAPLPRTEHH